MQRPGAHRRGLIVSLSVTALVIATGAGCNVASEDVEESGQSGSELNRKYDEAYGNRIANKALRVNGRGSGNWCLRETQNTLEMAGVKAMPRLPGAVDLDNWLMRQGDANLASWGFQKQARSATDIPRGSIIAWRPGQCGYHRQYGHIEIAVGGGRACSDFCGSIRTNCGAPNVYVPVGFGPAVEKCGTGTTSGDIDEKYQELGGCKSFLGAPTTNELRTPDGIGRYNVFERGSIYWTERTGAHEVHGEIRTKWSDVGWEAGVLGYPTTDEGPSADGKGRYNHFERGSIYWSERTGAHEVHGAIQDKWETLGWEMGILGYPVEDEVGSADGTGYSSKFERGTIAYTATTSAKEVHGRIHDKWQELGAQGGKLGYPTSDEFAAGNFRRSEFQNGAITWDPATDKFTVETKAQ